METLYNDIMEFKPDMILVSTTNATVFSDIEIVSEIKRMRQSLIVVLKGAIFYNADIKMLKKFDFSYVDFLIGGEIESSIGKIADYSLRKIGRVEDIPNIFYIQSNEKIIKTYFGYWENDLDSIPFPAREYMDNTLYVRPDTGEPMATIQVSRGCPGKCIYCLTPVISGNKVRFRSPQNVIEELQECYKKYNIYNFFFKADTFTINKEWVIELCTLIMESDLNGKIRFTANSRVKPLDKKALHYMRKAGCFMIAFGFESGSERTLKRIKKEIKISDCMKAVRWTKDEGILTYGFYMIGFPWENRDDIKKTEKLIYSLNTDFIEIHIPEPFYGTELFEEAKKDKVLKKDIFGTDYFKPAILGTRYVTLEELIKIRKKILFKYYFRHQYIIRRLKECKGNFFLFKSYLKYAVRLLKNVIKAD